MHFVLFWRALRLRGFDLLQCHRCQKRDIATVLPQVNLSGGVDQGAMLKSAGDLLSSAEATTQYSSSESSSGADNLNQLDSSSLLDTGMLATARQSDGARSTGQPVSLVADQGV